MRFNYDAKSIFAKIFGNRPDNKSDKSMADEREDLANSYSKMEKKASINYTEGFAVSRPIMSNDINRKEISKKAALILKEYIEARTGKGGFDLEEVEFAKTSSKKIAGTEEIIDNAKVAFSVKFLTPKGDYKTLYALVNYAAGEPDSYVIDPNFRAGEDLKEQVLATSDNINKFIEQKETKAHKTVIAFYNMASEVHHYETIDVDNMDGAIADLRTAGFKVSPNYIHDYNIGSCWEVTALPEQYQKMHQVLGRYYSKGLEKQYSELDWANRADQKKEEAPGYYAKSQQMKEQWVDRAGEKNPLAGPDDSYTSSAKDLKWQERSLEKVKAVDPAQMLKYESKQVDSSRLIYRAAIKFATDLKVDNKVADEWATKIATTLKAQMGMPPMPPIKDEKPGDVKPLPPPSADMKKDLGPIAPKAIDKPMDLGKPDMGGKKDMKEGEAEKLLVDILKKHHVKGKDKNMDQALDEIIKFFNEFDVKPDPLEEVSEEEKAKHEPKPGPKEDKKDEDKKEDKKEEKADDKKDQEDSKEDKKDDKKPPKEGENPLELVAQKGGKKGKEGDMAPSKGQMKEFGWPLGWSREPNMSGDSGPMDGMDAKGKDFKSPDGMSFPLNWDRPPAGVDKSSDPLDGMKEGDMKLPDANESLKVRAAKEGQCTDLKVETKQEPMTGMGAGSDGEMKLPVQESLKVRAQKDLDNLIDTLGKELTAGDEKTPKFAHRIASVKDIDAALEQLSKQKGDTYLAWNRGELDDYKAKDAISNIGKRIAQLQDWRQLDWHDRSLEKPASESATNSQAKPMDWPDRSLEKSKASAPYASAEWVDRSMEKRTKDPSVDGMMLKEEMLKRAASANPPQKWIDKSCEAVKLANKNLDDKAALETVKKAWNDAKPEAKVFVLQKFGSERAPIMWERALTARLIEENKSLTDSQVRSAIDNLWFNKYDESKREEVILKTAELETLANDFKGEEHPAGDSNKDKKGTEESFPANTNEYNLEGKGQKEEETPGSKDSEKYNTQGMGEGEENPGKPSNKPGESRAAELNKKADESASTVADYPRKDGLEENPAGDGNLNKDYKGEENKLAAEGREKYDVSEKTKVAEQKKTAASEGEAKTDTYKPSDGMQADSLQHKPIDPEAGKYDGDALRRPNTMSEMLDEAMGHIKGQYEYSKNVPFEAPEVSKTTVLPTQKKANKEVKAGNSICPKCEGHGNVVPNAACDACTGTGVVTEDQHKAYKEQEKAIAAPKAEEQSKEASKKKIEATTKTASWGSPQHGLSFEDMRANTEKQHNLVQNISLSDKDSRDVTFPDETGSVSHMPGTIGVPKGAIISSPLDPNWYAEEIFQGLRKRSYLTAQDGFEGMMYHEQSRGMNDDQKKRIAQILRSWGFNIEYKGLKDKPASTPFKTGK